MNVVGPSEPSEATKEFETLQAPPAHPPWNVTVRAMSAKELRVRWIVSVAWLNNISSLSILILRFDFFSLYSSLNGSVMLEDIIFHSKKLTPLRIRQNMLNRVL